MNFKNSRRIGVVPFRLGSGVAIASVPSCDRSSELTCRAKRWPRDSPVRSSAGTLNSQLRPHTSMARPLSQWRHFSCNVRRLDRVAERLRRSIKSWRRRPGRKFRGVELEDEGDANLGSMEFTMQGRALAGCQLRRPSAAISLAFSSTCIL
jgi:hypothetical protein